MDNADDENFVPVGHGARQGRTNDLRIIGDGDCEETAIDLLHPARGADIQPSRNHTNSVVDPEIVVQIQSVTLELR
jgi:hypothetical protein